MARKLLCSAVAERAEVQRVDMQDIEKPWLLPWCCWILDGEYFAQGSLILFRELPNDELIVLSVTLKLLVTLHITQVIKYNRRVVIFEIKLT